MLNPLYICIYIYPVIVYFESGIIFGGFTKWKSYDSSVHPSCNWSLQDPCHGNLRASSSERDHECHCISPRNVTQKIILIYPNIEIILLYPNIEIILIYPNIEMWMKFSISVRSTIFLVPLYRCSFMKTRFLVGFSLVIWQSAMEKWMKMVHFVLWFMIIFVLRKWWFSTAKC